MADLSSTSRPFREAEITLDDLTWGQGEILLIPYDQIPKKGNPIGLVSLLEGDRGVNFGRAVHTGIVLGKVPGYWTIPYNGVITAVVLNTNQGGFTAKFWKASGRIPTVADSINRNGYTITPPQTHFETLVLSDFTTLTVSSGDTFAVEITAIFDPTPTDIAGNLVILQH